MRFKHGLVVAMVAIVLLCGAQAETFLISSDLHIARDAEQPALQALREAPGDVLILLGDNTNNAHSEEHARVLAFLASGDRPAYVIPGNHDLTSRYRPLDFAAMYSEYGWGKAFSRDAASASCAVMTSGGTCFLLLDTNAYREPDHVDPLGGVAETTVTWVKDTLSSLPEGVPVIACGHHPLLPDRISEPLAEALREGGVKLYLCGHDHGFSAVDVNGLRQITVGQPHAYPGWAGQLEVSAEGYHWKVLPLYGTDDPVWREMSQSAARLGERMARGVLKDTPYEEEESAVRWFEEAFDMWLSARLTEEECARLLSDPAAQTWRTVETRTVVKDWILGILENPPQDVRELRGRFL